MKKPFYCLSVLLMFCTSALSEIVPDTVCITEATKPETKMIVAVSVQTPQWADIEVLGSYTGSPAYNSAEEVPGKAWWAAAASCNGVAFKDNKLSYDWQNSPKFNFSIASNTSKKYTVSIALRIRFEIHKKKADGSAGDVVRWSLDKIKTFTRDVWIVGVGAVAAAPVTAGTVGTYIPAPAEVVLLEGSQCVFSVNREPAIATNEPAPYWPDNSTPLWKFGTKTGSGVTFNASANFAGSRALTVECGNMKTIKVTSIIPELDSVDFKSEPKPVVDPNSGTIQSIDFGDVQMIADVGLDPEWKRADANGQNGRNEPFCIKRKAMYDTHIVFSAEKNLTFPTPVRVALNGTRTDPVDTTWQNFPTTVTCGWTSSFNEVCLGTVTLAWNYSIDGGQKWIQIHEPTVHPFYMIWSTPKCPDIDFTKAHIDHACKTANGATTLEEIGNKIGLDTVAKKRFALTQHHATAPWTIIDTKVKSNCVSLCTLMQAILLLLGDDSAQIWYVYARHDSWNELASTSNSAHERCTQHNPCHNLGYWSGGPNSWEACCLFQNKWWMGGLGDSKEHPLEVLRRVTDPNTTATGQHQCYSCAPDVPVAYPASTGGVIPPKPTPLTPYPPAIPNYP